MQEGIWLPEAPIFFYPQGSCKAVKQKDALLRPESIYYIANISLSKGAKILPWKARWHLKRGLIKSYEKGVINCPLEMPS